MDNVTKWWAICTECSHETEPFDDRKTIEAEIVLHKIKTGHMTYSRFVGHTRVRYNILVEVDTIGEKWKAV